MDKRVVHDIMWMFGAPVAYDIDFIKKQHQTVCPWCQEDIGKPFHLEKSTFGELYEKLFNITRRHMKGCKNAKTLVDLENPNVTIKKEN